MNREGIEKRVRKVFFIVLFLLWVFQESSVIAEIETVFSSERSVRETILRELESTTSTLELAIHDITSFEMAHALVKAKQRGVKVRVIADSKQAKVKSSQITYLIHQGIMVKTLRGMEKGVMNHRFVILDGQKVVTGSYEWSEVSEKRNYENLVILKDNEVVTSYQKEFDRLWREKRVIK